MFVKPVTTKLAAGLCVPLLLAACARSPRSVGSGSPSPASSSPTAGQSPISPGPSGMSGPSAQDLLDSFLAAHPEAVVHSGPTAVGAATVAVVGLETDRQHRSIAVVSLSGASPVTAASLRLPTPFFDISPDPVQVADVTGDGSSDFLMHVEAADNHPSVLVSNDGGTWRLIPVATATGGVGDPYIGKSATIDNGQMFSDATAGAVGSPHTDVWGYDRARGLLTATDYADSQCPEVDFTPDSSDLADQILATNVDCASATTVVKGVRGPCPSQPFACRSNLPSYTAPSFSCAAGSEAQPPGGGKSWIPYDCSAGRSRVTFNKY